MHHTNLVCLCSLVQCGSGKQDALSGVTLTFTAPPFVRVPSDIQIPPIRYIHLNKALTLPVCAISLYMLVCVSVCVCVTVLSNFARLLPLMCEHVPLSLSFVCLCHYRGASSTPVIVPLVFSASTQHLPIDLTVHVAALYQNENGTYKYYVSIYRE